MMVKCPQRFCVKQLVRRITTNIAALVCHNIYSTFVNLMKHSNWFDNSPNNLTLLCNFTLIWAEIPPARPSTMMYMFIKSTVDSKTQQIFWMGWDKMSLFYYRACSSSTVLDAHNIYKPTPHLQKKLKIQIKGKPLLHCATFHWTVSTGSLFWNNLLSCCFLIIFFCTFSC